MRDLDCPSVLVDNRAAAREATEHLLALGHRRIAFVEGPAGLHTSAHRLEGFEPRSRRPAPRPVVLPGGFEFEAGAAAAETLLAGELPDAVLGVNDEVAIGLLTGLRRGGVDVPGQVSVAGIDDTRPARLVDLTSVSLPLHELGEIAARVILEGAEGDVVLPHRLVRRATPSAREAGLDVGEQLVRRHRGERGVDDLDLDRPVVAGGLDQRADARARSMMPSPISPRPASRSVVGTSQSDTW